MVGRAVAGWRRQAWAARRSGQRRRAYRPPLPGARRTTGSQRGSGTSSSKHAADLHCPSRSGRACPAGPCRGRGCPRRASRRVPSRPPSSRAHHAVRPRKARPQGRPAALGQRVVDERPGPYLSCRQAWTSTVPQTGPRSTHGHFGAWQGSISSRSTAICGGNRPISRREPYIMEGTLFDYFLYWQGSSKISICREAAARDAF